MVNAVITCPYCTEPAKLVTGSVLYPHRPDLYTKQFWACKPCDAMVGVHPGTTKPLGRLANAELRKAKMAVHAKFDPLWKSKKMSRSKAYQLLADKLGIKKKECHVGFFDLDTCRRALAVLVTKGA